MIALRREGTKDPRHQRQDLFWFDGLEDFWYYMAGFAGGELSSVIRENKMKEIGGCP